MGWNIFGKIKYIKSKINLNGPDGLTVHSGDVPITCPENTHGWFVGNKYFQARHQLLHINSMPFSSMHILDSTACHPKISIFYFLTSHI